MPCGLDDASIGGFTIAFEPSITHILGLSAGALIVGVGAFVLVARPGAWLNRFFFALALVDGAGTILFQLAAMADDSYFRAFFAGSFWYFQIAFISALLAFGLVFPRPVPGLRSDFLAAAPLVAGAVAVAAYVARHHWFWTPLAQGSDWAFSNGPAGNVVMAAFVAGVALIAARLTRHVLVEASVSHRRQAAFVLGGMVLAYAPYATTSVVQALLTRPFGTFFSSRIDVSGAYWAFALMCVVLVGAAVVLLRDTDAGRARDRRFVLGCLSIVLAFTAFSAATPSAAVLLLLQNLGLLAYPMLLGYAIVRYEVFDIDRRLRRIATGTLVATVLAAAFIVAENAAEEILAERVFGGLDSAFVAGAGAAVAVTVLSVPVARASHSLVRRLIPELDRDELRERKVEVYRHGLEGALADGMLEERESRTLAALRQSLGVTDEEHARLVAEVRSRAGAAPRTATP